MPNTAAARRVNALAARSVFADARPLDFLDALYLVKVDAAFIDDIPLAVAHSNNLGSHLRRFFSGVNSNVAAAGNDAGFAAQAVTALFEHLLSKIAQPIAGGLGAADRTAERKPFSGQNTVESARDTLILAKHVCHFALAHADIPRRDIRIKANVAVHFRHQALAKAHYFAVGLAVGIKVRATLAATHGKACQGIFDGLFQPQELQNAEVDAGVKAHTALVGTNRAVVLHAKSAIDAHGP